jgi:hypothetical protein
MIDKTTSGFAAALISCLASPALAQGQSYQGIYQTRHVERAHVYEGRNAAIIPAPDVAPLPYFGREALIHSN